MMVVIFLFALSCVSPASGSESSADTISPVLMRRPDPLPPFNALPVGVTSSHTQLGIMAGMHWNDISLDFQGLSSNKEFRAAPMIGIVQMEQLSNGLALRTYVKTIFPSQALTVGPIPTKQANGGLGQQVIAGASLLF